MDALLAHRPYVFSATMCRTPSPRFQVRLSISESTILSPTIIDRAHTGIGIGTAPPPLPPSRTTKSDAILAARTHDLDTLRATRALLCNHHRQRDHMDGDDDDDDDDDRRRREGDRIFSPGLVGCGGA